MKILQINDMAYEAGGAEKSVRLIADGLTDRGHRIEVVATDHQADGRKLFADHLVPAITGSAPARFSKKLWHREAYRQVRTIVDDFDPDCIHLHTIGLYSPAVLAATASRPRILTVHGPEDWTLKLLRWNLPTATRAEGLSAADRARYAYLRFVQRPAYRARLKHVDRILTPSRFFAETVRPDVGSARTYVVPNGIERVLAAAPVRRLDRILFVGRLERVKGVDVLLRAFRTVVRANPDARLVIVGDGGDRAALEAAHAGLVATGQVRFTGWLTPAEVAGEIAEAAVVVVPSLWPENFPTVALEALQAGRALVASQVGGLPELVGNDNGVLVPPGDVAALADALGGLIGQAERLAQLGAGSAARAGRYDIGLFLDTLEHHYEEVSA
ncbi:glycosyltransferase family 4 protein [Paractinoplanes durhamensis]|uniref:Glycosyltransferase subfamily 4-like N-terminal domain-containing protein n=1 Tax=Paractinoplanes durhamensis TaxID=113563 RepID=A0ABQ3Z9Z8_9ACTN|nr:glycosyltransferase family 4 protein [Actinoplanes durhamensis]GIE06627.1 hypothetical protein Adu01nite_79770 [Actinoplanes durhamensis]